MSRIISALCLAFLAMPAALPARAEPCRAVIVNGRLIVIPLFDDLGRQCLAMVGRLRPRAFLVRPAVPAARFTTGPIGPFTTGELGPATTFSNAPPTGLRRR